MQFQHTLKALLTEAKTETSRIVKPEHRLIDGAVCTTEVYGFYALDGLGQRAYFNGHRDRVIYAPNKDYAIQPGRTARSIGRFRIVDIWQQDVRTLAPAQVNAEGFETWQDFWQAWCGMHDPKALPLPHYQGLVFSAPSCRKILIQRPTEHYMAWRMRIEVLWDTVQWDTPAVRALQIEKPALK